MNGYARIKRISYRDDGKYLISIEVGNSSGSESVELVILDELICRLPSGISEGEIDCELVETLDEYAAVTAAFSSACASLAFTQCSALSLVRKLISKGFSKRACEGALEILIERGYINESANAIRRAEIMTDKAWGRRRIVAKLYSEGYSDDAIKDAEAVMDDFDFVETCMRLIKKKYHPLPDSRLQRDKMYASLLRLGYSSSEIREALRLVGEDE